MKRWIWPGRIWKKSVSFLLSVLLVFWGSGCGSVFFSKSYHWSRPFVFEISRDAGDALEISNYSMLKSAILDLVSNHEERSVLRFKRYNGSPIDDLAAVCLEIRATNPLGAYAVGSISCDTSRIISYYMAEVQITYRRSWEDIQRIVGIFSLPELERNLREAVAVSAEELVLRAYLATVSERVISDMVEEIYLSDPVTVISEPAVSVSSYPAEGINRIYDVVLRYGESPETLELRRQNLSSELEQMRKVIQTALPEAAAPRLALEAARLLYAHVRSPGTAADGGSAYDALLNREAGPKGMALAYKALCDSLGLECLVVDGNIGDMGAERHYWNILKLEGDWYHVDISRFGGELSQAFLLDDASLWGIYIWNTERYPECAGSLRVSDLINPGVNWETPIPEADETEAGTEDIPGEFQEEESPFPDT